MARAACAALGIPAVRQRATAKTRAALERAESVLFVCLGNICRSPFAEHYARRVLPAAVAVRSSGLYPRPNRPSPEPAILAASEQGVDLSRHRADVLNEESVGRSDLIFSFDESVHQEIRRRFPAARGKLHRFALLADDGPVEVPDPFGGSLDRFRVVYRRIAAVLDSAAARLADGRLEDGSGIAPSQVARPNATADARGAATDCAAVSSGF
jgi:protein-tyrosine phosphatase